MPANSRWDLIRRLRVKGRVSLAQVRILRSTVSREPFYTPCTLIPAWQQGGVVIEESLARIDPRSPAPSLEREREKERERERETNASFDSRSSTRGPQFDQIKGEFTAVSDHHTKKAYGMRGGELLRILALGEGRQVNRESKFIGRLFQQLYSERH